jgi:hypothetical protein
VCDEAPEGAGETKYKKEKIEQGKGDAGNKFG